MSHEVNVLVVLPAGAKHRIRVSQEPQAFQQLVGGYFEAITLPECVLFCDEDGKAKRLAINITATAMATDLGWQPVHPDLLCGPVVFCGPVDKDGWVTDWPDASAP